MIIKEKEIKQLLSLINMFTLASVLFAKLSQPPNIKQLSKFKLLNNYCYLLICSVFTLASTLFAKLSQRPDSQLSLHKVDSEVSL